MLKIKNILITIWVLLLIYIPGSATMAQSKIRKPAFRVIAFYTGKNDMAHISYVQEANEWFSRMASRHNFVYETTNDWAKMNDEYLSSYEAVIFLDTRPEKPEQRAAFQKYMEHGGGWLGFHFAAFALTPSAFRQDWDWYHQQFLGSGEYLSNTWRPTRAYLHAEQARHPVYRHLNKTITASPNEWYRWKNDLSKNPDIEILYAIDPKSFPLGTGPKAHEIWHSGYYPVVWTNRNYKMVYFNMGHNDMDYEHKYGKDVKNLSYTYANPEQEKLILNALKWVAGKR
jgi:hypothetical protein